MCNNSGRVEVSKNRRGGDGKSRVRGRVKSIPVRKEVVFYERNQRVTKCSQSDIMAILVRHSKISVIFRQPDKYAKEVIQKEEKKMKIKKLILSLIVTVIFITLGWFYAAAQEVIKVGFIAPLTGPGALWGLVGKEGLIIGVEDVNAKGGIRGKKLEVVSYDSQSKPTITVTLGQRLIYEDKVPLIIGPPSSLENLALMEVTERAKIPLFIPGATDPTITEKGYKWVWRLTLTDKMAAGILGKYINEKPDWNNIAILYENTDFGRSPSAVLAGIIKESKGKQLVAMETYNRGDSDLTGQLIKIKKANPDVLSTWSYPTELALIARQRQQIGLGAQLIANSSGGFPEYVQLAGAAAEGSMFTVPKSFRLNPNPGVQTFTKRYEEKFHKALGVGALEDYNAAFIISEVFEKVGTDPEKIRNALNTMTFHITEGTAKFDANGQNIVPGVIIGKIEGGTQKFLELFEIR